MRAPVDSEVGGGLYDRFVRVVSGPETTATPACPVCDGKRAQPVFQVEGIEQPIVVCTGCGLGHFHPALSPGQIAACYPEEYYGGPTTNEEYYGGPTTKFQPFVELLVRAVARRHINFLSEGLPPGARVLDVGCGRGVLLGPLADRRFEVHGVELSEGALRGADPRADVRIAPRLSDAGYEEGSFDQVIIWHVLEHVADPKHTIEECRRILRPGGRLIVAVPNFSSAQARWSGPAWFHLDAPRHLYHFPVSALKRLIRNCGFEIASEHHFSLRQNPFGWIQSALNRFSKLPSGALYTLLHQRGRSTRTPFDRKTRLAMWIVLLVSIPPAILLSILEALLRTGATVHVVARRRRDD
jgi:SAM-dependent methyltransferase